MGKEGTRTVQHALEAAADVSTREMIAGELRDHVWQAIDCPCANYALQQCIYSLPAPSVQFIIDEITAESNGVCLAAQHRFGCRILQRLLERCPPKQVQDLV